MHRKTNEKEKIDSPLGSILSIFVRGKSHQNSFKFPVELKQCSSKDFSINLNGKKLL